MNKVDRPSQSVLKPAIDFIAKKIPTVRVLPIGYTMHFRIRVPIKIKNIPKSDFKSVTISFISFPKKIFRHPIFRGGPVPPKFSNFKFSFSPFLILTLEVTYVRI